MYTSFHDKPQERPEETRQEHCIKKGYTRSLAYKTAASRKGKGFTLIELLVVIAIISLLVSILLPSLNKAKQLARTVVCLSNLKQMGLGIAMYVNDNDGLLPRPYLFWYDLDDYIPIIGYWDYLTKDTVWKCPSNPNYWTGTNYTTSYVYNYYIQPYTYGEGAGWSLFMYPQMDRLALLENPDVIALVTDGAPSDLDPKSTRMYYYWFPFYPVGYLHSGGGNFLFMDGHAEWLREEGVDLVITNIP